MLIKDSRILVTGGSSGIGKSLAKIFTSKGGRVIITGRDEKKLKMIAQRIQCDYCVADQEKVEDIERLFKYVKGRHGKINTLINNAAIGIERKKIEQITFNEFESVFKTNVFGTFHITKIFIPLLKNQKGGNIVNISSTCVFNGYAGGSAYVSSKCALEGMTKCWQQELAESNIRVHLIRPGNVSTAWGNPERKEETHQKEKLHSDDVAKLVVALLEQNANVIFPEVVIAPLFTYKNNSPLFD